MSKRICFIGPAGCGKTTLVTAVFAALKQAGRKVEHVYEFIRTDIQINGPMTSIWEQYRTRQYQKELEDATPPVDFIICDSGTLMPYFYAVLYANANEPRQRLVLQDMYKYLLDDLYLRRYDLIFYLPMIRHQANLDDGTRYQSDAEIAVLDEHMRLVFTKLHRMDNVHVVESGLDLRLEEVLWKILGADNLNFQLASARFGLSWRAEQN